MNHASATSRAVAANAHLLGQLQKSHTNPIHARASSGLERAVELYPRFASAHESRSCWTFVVAPADVHSSDCAGMLRRAWFMTST